VKELVVISGKGGTGKTTLTGAFAELAEDAVLADCDVDASDLHLLLKPRVRRREVFRSGRVAQIRTADCTGCGLCHDYCRFDAVIPPAAPQPSPDVAGAYAIDPIGCEGCGVCVRFCPAQAIDFPERESGLWFVSDTRAGPMVHARLNVAAENSGKLVSLVREQARRLAEATGRERIIIDGPPGIGCPVIAAITGATFVLAVAEPTRSGRHDLERVLGLAQHFAIPAGICINKFDLHPGLAGEMTHEWAERGVPTLGQVPYSAVVTHAQVAGESLLQSQPTAEVTERIVSIWQRVAARLDGAAQAQPEPGAEVRP